MARPTDPVKLAALRAQEKLRAARYRARKAAEAKGQPVPPELARKTPATYRPSSRVNPAERAADLAARHRAQRAEVIGALPSVRNPESTVYVPREAPRGIELQARPSKKGQRLQAARIRENLKAGKLQALGKRAKEDIRNELTHGSRAEQLQHNLSEEQQNRFQRASERLAKVSQQTLAVFMHYEAGWGDYHSILDQLSYPKTDDVETSLTRLEGLADLAGKAEGLYGPKALGGRRLSV